MVCICICVCMYIYIYVERERDTYVCICIYTHMYVYVYIYVYIYIYVYTHVNHMLTKFVMDLMVSVSHRLHKHSGTAPPLRRGRRGAFAENTCLY